MASKAAPLMAFALMLSGCARFEVGLEQTATLDQRALTTISALGTQNAQLATQVAALATPTPAILEQSTPTATASGLSAAGIRISYVEGGDVWLLDGLRLPVQLTDDGGVERAMMAGDGQVLAYTRRIGPTRTELRALRADGGGDRVLLSEDTLDGLYDLLEGVIGTTLGEFHFVPGTHRILFNTRSIFAPSYVGTPENQDLLSLDADSGKLTRLLDPGLAGLITVSPSGGYAALVGPTSLGLIDTDGRIYHREVVSFPLVVTLGARIVYPTAVWSSDSSAVGLVVPPWDLLNPAPSDGILWRAAPSAGTAMTLSSMRGELFSADPADGPHLSPSLGEIAFLKHSLGSAGRDLRLAGVDGSSPFLYAQDVERFVGWLVDGRRFLYQAAGSIWLGARNSGPIELGEGDFVGWVDERQYLSLRSHPSGWSLMLGAIGSEAQALAVGPTAPTSIDFVLPAPTLSGCIDRAYFVSDLTIPDDAFVPPGVSFVKTWRLRNEGTCTWSEGYDLVFEGGVIMGGPASIPLRSSVAPGATLDLSVHLAAPYSPGRHRGEWKLRNAVGRRFGIGPNASLPFWVQINVEVGSTPEGLP